MRWPVPGLDASARAEREVPAPPCPGLPAAELAPEPGAPVVPDTDALIEELYRLHGRPLLRYLLRITFGDRREAEDLLQETVFRAWRSLREQRLDVSRLRPWLYTVARRAAIDAARARRARPAEAGADMSTLPDATDDIDRMLIAMTVRRGLMQLSPAHRRVLIEVFYHGLSAQRVAETLGIPEGTVKSRTYYALRALSHTITTEP